MFEVTCWDSYDRVIEGFTQWDINQTLYLKNVYDDFGLTEAPMFHFCNKNSNEALVVQSTVEDNNVIAVKVPNILLQESYPLIAYMYVYSLPSKQKMGDLTDVVSSASAKALVAIKLAVRPRVKPSQYKYVENIDSLTVAQIEKEIKDRLDKLESELKESVNSKISELEELVLEFETWLSKSEISTTGSYIISQTYEVTTDSSGLAALPFNSEDTQANYVFINGLLAVEEKDYQITDNNIQLVQSEFVSGEDVVTFVVLESVIDGKTGESKSIDVSSEIYEIKTDTDGYAQLPFTYDDKVCQIFINGVLAIKGKDYSIDIDSNSIQIEKSEFITGEDVITFVVLQALNEDVADSKSIDITLDVYEAETNKSGYAAMPLVPKIMINHYGDEAVQIYINGMYAIANKDYYIEDSNIQLINSELGANDVITFVVFKSEMKNNSDESYTNLIPITEEELNNICK